jgi:uncharacterized protein YfaS (alpha-2-macroglobulin family)
MTAISSFRARRVTTPTRSLSTLVTGWMTTHKARIRMGGFSMTAFVRAGRAAALALILSFSFILSAACAEKSYSRDELADAVIKLEADIKKDAGAVTKTAPALRREAEAAFAKNDQRGGLTLLTQLVAVAPEDAGNWLRLARTVLTIRPTDDRERTALWERAATAAYAAYLRTSAKNEEAEALSILGRSFADRKLWRPALDTLRLSLELREVADLRGLYERLRDDHGFRLLDYTIDADAASPRACFQFSESLPGRRTDLSPFIAVGGMATPALSADGKQLCVEGLKHGERYNITLRAGIPSTVKETLAKSADYNIYVRDRKPSVRFAAKAYVLPRTGQRGIPVISVNTPSVDVQIYRVGDRNLIETVLGRDFQRNLDRFDLEKLGDENGVKVWNGQLAVDNSLNADVTTAFPVDEAVGELKPGVYIMSAEPAGVKSDRSWEALATQWFIVSDLGLTAYSGNDGINVFVASLASAAPKGEIELRLLARNNEVLATKKTDTGGRAAFEPGLTRGEGGASPALIVAVDPKGDYAFLNLKSPAFDLTDRGVAGRSVPAGLDAFVYTERGVYRTGETVHVTALLRDGVGVAALGVPLTLVVERPDGVEYRRVAVTDQGLGGRNLDVPIAATATTGTWRVRAFTDPKRPAVGETSFLVEDYVPDRIEFDLKTEAKTISKTTPIEVALDGRFLYGAPAAGLALEGEIKVKETKERLGYPGYQFGVATTASRRISDEDEEVEDASTTQTTLEDMPATDDDGKATFSVALDKLPSVNRPLEAQIVVRMAETGGRAVERSLTVPVAPSAAMIGVKPLFAGRSLGEGDTANFDVVMVAPDGSRQARKGLRWELLKIESRYQWYRHDGSWNYEPIRSTKRVADGSVDATSDGAVRISAPLQWGRYRLEVRTDDSDGPTTAVGFDAGWYTEASADTPDMLEIALDKGEYVPGDTMTVAVTARTAGKVVLNVVGDKLITSVTQDVPAGLAKLTLPVGRDWGNGAYVVATLLRPLDAAASRMPGRAIGVAWFGIDRKGKTLALDMKLPPLLRPNTTLRVPVKIDGLANEQARLVVAVVDLGILNLTNYKPPAPDEHYLGQRKLTADIRDLYGQLLDGMQGTRGSIRTGGDGGGPTLQASPPTQPPVALYSGLITVGPDGNAEVAFDVPEFAGTVRVMAVAWSKDKVGRANGDVIVRDPVVVTATLPRFILSGDRTSLQLDVDNVEGAAGQYRVSVESDGPVKMAGQGTTLNLPAKKRDRVSIPITSDAAGLASVKVKLTGPGDFALERNYRLAAKPATQALTRRFVKPLGSAESLTLSSDLFADLVPGTGTVAVSVGPSTALDAATLLKALDRYPFGCSEQITSRALPLLYVNELAVEAHLAMDTAIDQRIRDAIERLMARQGSTGAFGLWSVGGDDAWLDSYVTDFLTRARERGFAVPETGFKLALDRLKNFVGNAQEPGKDGGRDLAYALYVLARNGAAPVGDLRYIADTKFDDLATPIAKAQVAAALALMGDRTRAERAYAAAVASITPPPKAEYGRVDYGSTLRDAAAVVTLAAEGGAGQPLLVNAVQKVETARAAATYTSTQENAWMVLAARALGKGTRISLQVGAEQRTSPLYRTYRASEVRDGIKIANLGDAPLQAVVSVSGAPVTPEPPAEKGFRIERSYFTLDGDPVDPSVVPQNTRLAVVLKITEPTPQYGRILVADYLPAGFEIDNPRLVSSGDTGTLDWIENAAEPTNAEFRDDRFSAAFERSSNDAAVFAVAYVVRAVAPGRYVLPQAYVEDMYRPDRFGRTATGSVEVTAAK